MNSEQTTESTEQACTEGEHMSEPTTTTLAVPGATLTYDVHEPDNA